MAKTLGILVPVGGGDPIPLNFEVMTIGRRNSCDICLNFPNVSGVHCELSFRNGVWSVKDMGSTNGVFVNGERILQRVLPPGTVLDISKKHHYKVVYDAPDGVEIEDPSEEVEVNFSQSLMEKAGLEKPRKR